MQSVRALHPGASMKLAVTNFSGNVGKTSLARHPLATRFAGRQVVAI
jgi:hypothetical protein